MNTKNVATPSWGLLLGVLASVCVGTASADVMWEEKITVSGAGLMGMGNMSGTSKTIVARDRARTESNLQFESGMMRALARGAGQSVEIVRLDEDKIYVLDPAKKTYTESTFAEQREQMQRAMEQAEQAQAAQQTSGVDESQCEWSDARADVKRGGERASIAGFDAERVTVTAVQSCKDRQTGQVCEFGLTLDQWLAPGFEASDEALAYQRAYAEKLGMAAASSRDFAERAKTMFGRYETMWKQIAEHMGEIEGYPVKASFALGIGGPQCTSAQQLEPHRNATPAMGIGGVLGGALGGVFGRKRRSEPQAVEPAPVSDGLVPLMTVTSELVSVSKAPADASLFEVPAGYRKEE